MGNEFTAVALFALVLACWSGVESPAQEKKGKGVGVPPPLVPKWEYKVASLPGDDQDTETELNNLGEEGWELAGTPGETSSGVAGGGGAGWISTKVRLILRRPKQ